MNESQMFMAGVLTILLVSMTAIIYDVNSQESTATIVTHCDDYGEFKYKDTFYTCAKRPTPGGE